jgi:hypothetical protein
MVGLGLRMTGSTNSGATNGWDNGWVGTTNDGSTNSGATNDWDNGWVGATNVCMVL